MQYLWKWVDELVGKGLEWKVIIQLFFYISLSLVPLALPLAIPLALPLATLLATLLGCHLAASLLAP